MEETSFDFLKWGLVLAAWPIWAPFARALWKEFRRAMRPEGGLTGPIPSPGQRRRIEEEMAREEQPQVHESLAHRKAQLSAGPRHAGRNAAGSGSRGGARPAPGPSGGSSGAARATFRRSGQDAGGGPQRPRFR